jgi:hypothetical protein
MEVKSEYFDNDVDYMYCRCCFQLFTDSSHRFDFTFDFLSSLEDLFQFQLKFDGFDCSRWICEKCYEIVTNFRKFKIETIEKQAKFSKLIAANQHKEISNIQNLTVSTVSMYLEFEDEMIKAEPLEDLPETVVIDMPPLKTKGSVSSKPKRKKRSKKLIPKSLLKNRPSYERNLTPQFCALCRKSYMNIITHRIKKHGKKFKFTCVKDKKCKFFTYDYKEYTKHRLSHNPIRSDRERRVCPYCAVVVSTLDFHIKNVHLKERNYFCDLCSYASYHKEALKLHMKGQHMEKLVTCKECGFKTNMESKLKRHIEYNHTERVRERNFFCAFEDCDKAFETKYSLKYHVDRIHKGSLNFPCDHPGCKKSFHTNVERMSHEKNMHGNLKL